jgi:phytoene desaturase
MVKLFQDLGGTLRLNTPIKSITTEGNRATGVLTADGRTETFSMVASNADVVHTYAKLLGGHPRGAREGKRLAGKRHSMSLFVIYFGLRGMRPEMQHHTILFGPRYRELIKEIFSGPNLPDDFSLYLHAPSVTDSSLAPPGHSAYYVLSPVPHLGHAAIDWSVEGPRYRDRILAYLEAQCMPNLRRDLVTSRILTPFDFRDTLNAHHGSAFSVEPILTQSAWFRPHNRDATLSNLYFVGAGTHPGAGIPGVVGSAKATAGLMIADAQAHAMPATLARA